MIDHFVYAPSIPIFCQSTGKLTEDLKLAILHVNQCFASIPSQCSFPYWSLTVFAAPLQKQGVVEIVRIRTRRKIWKHVFKEPRHDAVSFAFDDRLDMQDFLVSEVKFASVVESFFRLKIDRLRLTNNSRSFS